MEAEEERCDRLAPQEKIAEDGAQLQRQLSQDPTMTLLLQRCQQTRYNLLLCDASECLEVIEQGRNRQTATFRHRILVDVAFGDSYHVSCLKTMLDLPRLARSRFMLDTKPYRWNHNAPWRWALLVEAVAQQDPSNSGFSWSIVPRVLSPCFSASRLLHLMNRHSNTAEKNRIS
ncbi:hypothetical protein AUP68_06521 [Ilyonectria robusta]